MSGHRFSQPRAMFALSVELMDLLQGKRAISARLLAETVARGQPYFSDVPPPVLRVHAAVVLRAYLESPTEADIESAGLSVDEKILAYEFYGNELQRQANALANFSNPGGNIVSLDAERKQ